MAPMVAASDYPFRYFLRNYCGVDLTYTQMLHAKNLVDAPKFRSYHLDLFETGVKYPKLHPSQLHCLQGLPLPDMEHYQEPTSSPVMVQLAGHDDKVVVRAAQMIWDHTEGRVTGIDLNLGCPQSIARTGNYGAHLMERDFDQVCHILGKLRKALPASTAVSAKIRLPESDATLLERIPRLVDTGINFLTVHGRTIHENKTKVGPCHVERIRLAVESAQRVVPNFPIVANGGMEDYDDIQQILQRTGAVAAMSSEALLETPILFQRSSWQLNPRERLNQQFSFARDYLHTCATVVPPVPGDHAKKGSFAVIRSHLCKFLHRYLQEQPDLRLQLVSETTTIRQAVALVDQLEAHYLGLSNKELLDSFESSSPSSSWYRRHRQPDRRVHQKEVKLVSSLSPFPPPPKENDMEDRKKQILRRLAKMKQEKETKLLNISGTRLPRRI
jgi:tRNA-dihydrouridine synthase 4